MTRVTSQLLYEMVTMGARPYDDWTNERVMDEVTAGYTLPVPDVDPGIAMVIQSCWQFVSDTHIWV